jgi:hypothetical protein
MYKATWKLEGPNHQLGGGELWYTGICVCSHPCYVFVCVCEYGMLMMYVVVTLTLGSQPRQEVARLQAKREAWEACRMLPGVQESVRE